jgi:AcrR family transcriptional regulator
MTAKNTKYQQKENKRIQILETALKVFARHGYDGSTIEMITKEAGIAKGLLYTYYKNKEELLEQLIVYGLKKAGAFLDQTTSGQLDNKEAFATSLRNMVQLFQRDADFWRLYMMLVLQSNTAEKFQSEAKIFMEAYLGIYATYFQHKKCPNPMAEAMLFGAVLDGLMIDLMVTPGDYPVNEVLELIIEKFG